MGFLGQPRFQIYPGTYFKKDIALEILSVLPLRFFWVFFYRVLAYLLLNKINGNFEKFISCTSSARIYSFDFTRGHYES